MMCRRPHAVYTAAPITYAARIRHRQRCRTRAGRSAGHVYNLDTRCRADEGRQYRRHWTGTSVCWPAASGLRIRKVRHLRRRMCRPYRRHCRRHLPAWVRQARLFSMYIVERRTFCPTASSTSRCLSSANNFWRDRAARREALARARFSFKVFAKLLAWGTQTSLPPL
jgi:hypothetical protein